MARENPYLKPSCHGRASESRLSRNLGGKNRAGSGAIEGYKGDTELEVDHDRFLIESKSTVNQSISVKKAILDKICREARDEGRLPALSISFVDEFGNARDHDSDWVAVPARLLEQLIKAAG